ncbi:NAD-dependent epimerase/dehydratase [Sulfitobacter noctilucae]|uniref:NAD(P)-dependent oxidoreductase n=1 Tax=Sulfitobacter noctilucae TaxID=1342302 RepID=UPI00046A9BE4|nr:NAD(P)H-binding protein [Sulfitobacter noctilucae]KIN61740.1 NAD-dependent epimerase/dehydratase [Sulfitobacter noctilucae]
MSDTAKPTPTLVIFGGGGATGQAAIKAARSKGFLVRAVDHTAPENPSADEGITYVTADVLEDDLRAQVRGADAVVSCLGVGNDPQTLLDPPPLYTKGTEAICDAMKAEGITRLVVISASFVEEKNRGPIWFKLPAMVALHRVFEQMAEMERNLVQRPWLAWTAVRPGWLMEAEASNDYTVQADVIPENMIRTRHADLADFMVSLAQNDEWVRATPAIARVEPPEASSLEEVAKEMLPG